jgi:stage II sporulation SpoAA-like protein
MHTITGPDGNVITVRVTGKLSDEDYGDLIPRWESVIADKGSMRLLFEMRNFDGWGLHAAWDDLKFDIENRDKIERVAMVGDKPWEKWLTKLGALFVHAEVRYFDLEQLAEAERWIREP